MISPYTDHVRLLVNLLPIVAKQTCFALKGGTAINLFARDMPRLSVDIDLVYLPLQDRDKSLSAIDVALTEIADEIKKRIPRTEVTALVLKGTDKCFKLLVRQSGIAIKIEVTPVLRGSVYPAESRRIAVKAEKEFGFVEMTLLSFEDLFAGKICAALDRQHPRDLYDTHWLLQDVGIDERLKNAFLVYLMGHHRPMAELLDPQPRDISPLYRTEFEGMAFEAVALEHLQGVVPRLVTEIHAALNDEDRHFLLTFKQGTQDWGLFPLPKVDQLPAIQWKMLNLARMSLAKRHQAAAKLERILFKQPRTA